MGPRPVSWCVKHRLRMDHVTETLVPFGAGALPGDTFCPECLTAMADYAVRKMEKS